MAIRSRNAYFGQNMGTIMCISKSMTSGHKVDSFVMRLAGFPSGTHTGPWSGDNTTAGSPRKVRGAIWLSYPSNAYDEPDYLSTNECDTSPDAGQVVKIALNKDIATADMTRVRFNFNNAICNQSTIYVGLYTPYPSVTKIAFAGDKDLTLIRNYANSIGTWSGRGIYLDEFNTSSPYTPSSIWLNPNDYTKIGKVDSSSWSVHYSYNAGSNSNVPISLAIHDYDKTSWGVRWEPVIRYINGSSDGVWDSVTLGSAQGFGHGKRYRFTLVSKGGEALSPSSWNPQDGLVTYTYQKPSINTGLTRSRATQHANQDNSFSISGTNNRAWSSYENEFQTHYRIKRGSADYTGWTNLGNITSWSRTAAEMRSLVPKANDGQTITLQMKRYSPSSSWYSDNTASNTFTVYYRPRVGISSASYRKNNSSGTTVAGNNYVIDDSSLTGVYLSWSYDTGVADAGYTQGYRIRLYDANQTLKKTYYTTAKNYTIPKADIPRIQQTYIDITPYYANDTTNTANYWYYNGTISKINFVRVVANIATPTITYPINNSDWINNKFRIAFTLPEDPDYGVQSGTYLYDNIEVMINGNYTIRMTDSTGQTSSGTCVKNTACFSTGLNGLTYKRNIVLCPGLISGFPDTSSYTIKVRVRKKYGTSSNNNWSSWSNTVTVKRTLINIPNYEGQFILASHYNYMKSTINRMRNTYNISWSNAPADAVVDSTKITYDRYSYNNVLYVLNDIKNRINSYTTFDQTACKFDSGDSLPTSFTVKQEYITNQETETTPLAGANYLVTILNRCNLLK